MSLLFALMACDSAARPGLEQPAPLAGLAEDQLERLDRQWRDCLAEVPQACAALGRSYHLGELVERDDARAVRVLRHACELGAGCDNLGYLVEKGLGTESDLPEAARLYERSCELGDLDGCMNHAIALQRGHGRPEDVPAAVELLGSLCAQDHAAGCNELGQMHLMGRHVEVDRDRAEGLLERGCELGSQEACNNLGIMRVGGFEAAFVSPGLDEVVRGDRLTVGLALPEDHHGADVEVRLDGSSVPGALARARRGRTALGRGTLVLATVPLEEASPGAHRLGVVVDGASYETGFTYAPPPHRLEVEVRRPDGSVAPARVALFDESGRPHRLAGASGAALDPMERDTARHSLYAPDGRTSIRLEQGRWRLLVIGGPLHPVVERWVELDGDQIVTVELPDRLASDAVTADLHIHTGNSGDAFVPDLLRYESLATAGLDVVVLTDHNRVTDASRLRSVAPGLLAVEGVELDLSDPDGPSRGHVNAFPVRLAAEVLEQDRRIEQVFDEVGEAALVQLNHPRGIQLLSHEAPRPGAHAWMNVVSDTPPPRVDAMELMNRFSWPLYRQVRQDWFRLLDAGQHITATGNSDSHGLAVELAGFPVNLVQVEGPLSTEGFVEALRAGRVAVSSGPVVHAELVEGERTAGLGERIEVQGDSVTLRASVHAWSWVPVHEVRVVVSGEVVHQEALEPLVEGTLRSELELDIPVSGEGWVVVEAGWPISDDSPANPEVGGLYAEVAPGYVPVGFTNPIRFGPPRP